MFCHLSVSFDDLDATNTAVLTPNSAFGYYTLQYNQQTSPNTPVLQEKTEIGHLTFSFDGVDATNTTVSTPIT